jgi:hypothetical protein
MIWSKKTDDTSGERASDPVGPAATPKGVRRLARSTSSYLVKRPPAGGLSPRAQASAPRPDATVDRGRPGSCPPGKRHPRRRPRCRGSADRCPIGHRRSCLSASRGLASGGDYRTHHRHLPRHQGAPGERSYSHWTATRCCPCGHVWPQFCHVTTSMITATTMNTTISGSMKAIQGDLPLRFQNDFGSNPGNIAFFPYGTYETRRQYVPRSSRGAPGKPHQRRVASRFVQQTTRSGGQENYCVRRGETSARKQRAPPPWAWMWRRGSGWSPRGRCEHSSSCHRLMPVIESVTARGSRLGQRPASTCARKLPRWLLNPSGSSTLMA